MAELSCAVNPAFPTGGTSANNNKDFPPISCPRTIPQNFNGKDASVEERGRIMISKLTKYPPLRRSLASINTARSYKYGPRAFGKNTWYSENFDVVKGLRSKVHVLDLCIVVCVRCLQNHIVYDLGFV